LKTGLKKICEFFSQFVEKIVKNAPKLRKLPIKYINNNNWFIDFYVIEINFMLGNIVYDVPKKYAKVINILSLIIIIEEMYDYILIFLFL